MPATHRTLFKLCLALAALVALVVPVASAGGATYEELPDPLERGSYVVQRFDPVKFGLATLQEPNGKGTAATGSNSTITLQIRGVMYMPENKPGKSPLLIFVHGNHEECDKSGGSGPNCTIFKRNDEGYAYLGENLASWGYTVVSLDQDQLMARQDSTYGKGMHNRRLLIMALLDKLKEANEVGLPTEGEDSNYNIGTLLKGKLDMTRIGLMGHSRGGDAVSSFIEYDHSRPVGERYPLRAVVSLSPVDYERHAPRGVPFMTVFGSCDGDVSNLQGARLYERSQYDSGDPYPRFQVVQVGGNHDAYNTVWQADGDDASATDVACKPGGAHSIRLSGEAGPLFTEPEAEKSYKINNTDKNNPLVNTRISGEPQRMGDQQKLGLATIAAFLRRFVGGEGAFEPYLTGELAAEGKPSVPQSACPTSNEGVRIPCIDRVADSYTAPPDERMDVIRPDTEHPTTLSALGTKLSASGFSNPYVEGGGVTPLPPTTANGIDWCDPDPKQTEPSQLSEGSLPTAAKPCPMPAASALGGQNGTREKAPVNGSYGRQLSLAWEEPVEKTGSPAALGTTIPAADGDVSGYKALYMAAAVNFFDPRNPARGEEGQWNPEAAPQDFTIAATDADGNEATVEADSPRYGTALQQTLGSSTARVHVILRDIRVPLSDLAEQGVDLSAVRKLELRFGEEGMPQSGSIQLADVSFQQAVGGSDVLLDSTGKNAGPGEGEPTSGPNPVREIEEVGQGGEDKYKRADGAFEIPDVTAVPGTNVWTVDDDKAQCPNAEFTHIQEAVEFANPWDTIVVCPGVYEESSTPVNSSPNPVQTGAKNGLTINKPLKIVGAGADQVTIEPAASLGTSLAGTAPYLRDGGGNVVTVSRQSLGSTEYDEEFVDISGVTIESPHAYAEAGVAFFNSSGRISNSVIGPLKRATSKAELAEKPYGWGIIETNSLIGAGSGTAERQVTVDHSLVTGYQKGGILFDDARGADGAAATTERSGIKQVGYVEDTTVRGKGANSLIPQTGIQYHAGASGHVTDSEITGNLFPSEPRSSVGVLLTEAETLAGGFHVSGSTISGNGYGLYNANITNNAVRLGAPAQAVGDYWGPGGPPIEGPSLTSSGIEGVSGKDSEEHPSVIFEPFLAEEPELAATPGAVGDQPPTAALVNPGDGEAIEVGATVEPVVAAHDDFGVKTVSLSADGVPIATEEEAPYVFNWTPTAAEAGKTVELEATVVDSSGQSKTSSVAVDVKAPPPSPGPSPAPPAGKVEFGKIKRAFHTGKLTLEVSAPGPGLLVVSGPQIRTIVRQVDAAAEERFSIRAKGKALRLLHRRGHVKVKVTISFTPSGGSTETTTRTITLVKKH